MSDVESSPEPIATSAVAASSSSAAAVGAKKKKKKKSKKAAGVGQASDPMESEKSPQELEAEAWLASLKEEDVINPKLLDQAYLNELKATFDAGKPFKYLQIADLLDNSFLRTLENELKGFEYFHKSNDLFEFAQSNDLKSVDAPLVNKLKSILYGKRFRDILKYITGIELGELEDSVSMSANVYGDTNTLLCHDDELHGRRIAYILYLVPPNWSKADGGALDLYDTDKDGQPSKIAKSLTPAWNTFTFFEVSPISFHQVSEVLTSEVDEESGENRVRISISGWFHGAPIERPQPFIEPALVCKPLADKEYNLDDWLSPDYRKPKNIAKISSQFSEESSIELPGFLKKEVYTKLMSELGSVKSDDWVEVGPANKRLYFVAPLDGGASSSFIAAVDAFLQSRTFGAFLESITGMTYLSSTGAVRRFTGGCYTLAHNESEERFEEGVDINLSCLQPVPAGVAGKKAPKWNCEMMGGSTHYIEEGAEDELMSLEPNINTLSIVYRSGIPESERKEARQSGTGGVMKFVKYVNHRASQPRYDFDYVFRVEPDEEDDDDEEEEEEEIPPPAKSKAKKSTK